MAALPYMKLYWGDYLADTGHLTAIEHGGYLLLIAHYWRTGSLPDCDAKLARIARMSTKEWKRHGSTILDFFPNGKHKRIEQERDDARLKTEKNKLSAEKRWNASEEPKSLISFDVSDANALPTHCEGNDSHSHSHIQTNFINKIIDGGATAPLAAEKKKKSSEGKGTRIPEGFPSADEIASAKHHHPSIDVDREAAKFRNHFLAASGQNALKRNWLAAWRNWLLRAEEFLPKNMQQSNDAGQKTIQDMLAEQELRKQGAIDRVISAKRHFEKSGIPLHPDEVKWADKYGIEITDEMRATAI